MGEFGQAIKKDIDSMTSGDNFSKFLDKVNEIYRADFKVSNDTQRDPNDNPRIPLLDAKYKKKKQNLGRQPVPDFYFTGRAENSFYHEKDNEGISYDYSDPLASMYMERHETVGVQEVVRRQFPVEEDSSSNRQQKNIDAVAEALRKILMQPRTIVVN